MVGKRYSTAPELDPPEVIGGFSKDRRRSIPVKVLRDGRYVISIETAKKDFDVLGTLEANPDFWEFRPDLGGWAGPHRSSLTTNTP